MEGKKVPFSQNKHLTDIVAYLTLIGWVVAYAAGSREASKFHLNQALAIILADLGLNVVFAIATLHYVPGVSLLLRAVCGLLSFCTVVLWVMGLVYAAKGKETPVPVLGEVKILK